MDRWIRHDWAPAHAQMGRVDPREGLGCVLMARVKRGDSFDHVMASQLRRDKHLTQEDMAAAVGKSMSLVRMWEKGQRLPTPDVIGTLADALGVDVDLIYSPAFNPAGDTLASYRDRQLGISREAVAELVGTTARFVKRVELAERMPPDPDKWALTYGLTLEQLNQAWSNAWNSRAERAGNAEAERTQQA